MQTFKTGALLATLATLFAAAPVLEASAEALVTNTVRKSCAAHKTAGQTTNGFYLVNTIVADDIVMVYCDQTTVANGVVGGWALVWSNLLGGAGKLTTDMGYDISILTHPIYKGAIDSVPASRNFFEVYTGLRYLKAFSDPANGGRREIRYDWAPTITGRTYRALNISKCNFTLDEADSWRVNFTSCQVLRGDDGLADMFVEHNNRRWTTRYTDNDNQNDAGIFFPQNNCSWWQGSGSPFWYNACWRGSIWGYGERPFSGRNSGGGNENFLDGNGAHYIGTFSGEPANNEGQGSGYGWLYVR